jgi:hypothetical protein
MSASVGFVTYLWHYLIARLLYDQLIWPLFHGRGGPLVPIGLAAAAVLMVVVPSRTRSARGRRAPRPGRRAPRPGRRAPRPGRRL